MARGWKETDPEKGTPNRHTRAKAALMLQGVEDPAALKQVILKLTDKRPEDVLDAVLAVLEPDG